MSSKCLSQNSMRKFALSFILTYIVIGLSGQNLIGFTGNEIMKYMNRNEKDMNYNRVSNSSYKYLKYTDNSDTETILFFLNNDSVCYSIRMICDLGKKVEKVKQFDKVYRKTGNNQWTDRRNGKNYHVVLKDEEWSSIITIEPENTSK